MIEQRRKRPESLTEKPPRALICHCLKCDDKWTVRMQMVQDPEPAPKTRGRKPQKRMIWIFPPEGFEQCNGCGARNKGEFRVIDSTLVKTDNGGRLKLHIPGFVKVAKPFDLTGLNLEDDLV